MKKITLLLILLCLSLSTNAQITTYPYSEDFEAGDGGWIADNTTNGTWALGTPASTVINSAASGVNSWATNLVGNYNNGESSNVISPVFDFSTLAAPSISFSIWWESEFSWDGTVLQSSIDGGTTWDNVGALDDDVNWYNDGAINGSPGGQPIGWTGRNGTGSNGWITASHVLDGLAGESNVILRIAFGSDASVNDEGVAFDDVTVFEVNCPEPIALSFIAATSTTANLSWTAGGAETAWEVVLQLAGTGPPTGAGVSTGDNAPYIAMSLSPATNYEAYVRADCGGDFSIWVGPLNFATECITIVAPYTEGFDNGGVIPLCWTMDGGEDWNFDDAAPGGGHVGDNGTITGNTLTDGFFAWVDASGNDGPSTLTTPLIDVSGLTTPSLSFFEISDNEGDANSQLDVEVWDGTAWNLMGTYNTNTAGWEERVINLSTLTITGDVQARFIFSEPVVVDFTDDIAIDDVTFDELPNCPNPSNLALVSATDTTATISWMANGTETAWEVVVQAPGTGIPTGSGMATTTNPYVITGLTAATDYEAYVIADCGTEFSLWIGPINFTTECTTFIAPYTEGFENAGVIPVCWTMSGGEDWNFDDVAPAFGHIGANGTITGTTLTNGFFAWVDASGNQGPTTLLTPLIDVSGLTTPALSFFEISDNEGGENAQLDVEVWDGAAWNLMGTFNTNTAGWEEKIINISTLTITGNVQARFIFSEPLGDFVDDIAIDDVTFDELPTCVNPSTLAIDSVNETTATLSWLANGTETAWEIVVQIPGTGVPTASGIATTTNPHVAMGLAPITDYEFYVRADCGTEFSDWIGPLSFSTECSTFIAPYTEGFENAGVIPQCWEMSGGEDWNFDNVTGNNHIGDDGTITGTTATNDFFAWVDASGNDGPTTLLTPFVDVSGLAEPALSFFEISDNEGNANAQLDVEVWDGAAWNLMGTYNTNTAGWELRIININTLNITGDVQARFIFSETVTGDFTDDIAIDDVTFDELPPCFFPNMITVANITETSVEISWLPGAGETAWEYIVQPVGTGFPTTAGTFTMATTVTVDMLIAGTVYEIYVRSDCNSTGDGFSDWTGPVIFSTLPANDECGTATMFTANTDGNCTTFTSGTIFGATQSPQANPCNGTPNDDVWFSFVAVSTDHAINLTNILGTTTFLSHGLYEGPDCNTLTNITCSTDDNSVANGLTIGNTYYIRIFSNNTNAETTTFDLCVISIPPPITVSSTQFTVEQLVEDVLVNSPCSTISNVTSSTGTNFGSDNGIGYFEANGSGFPFESGIIMTTGNAENAPGPEGTTLSDGGASGWLGDADLEAVINEGPTNNASIIEFDFVPFIQDMSFEFIFAAEEYGNFQCGFSDAFAFLLTDTVTGVTTNIALIPGTTTPVSVFTIRDMAFNGNCTSENPELFDAFYGPGGLPEISSPTNFIGRTFPLAAMSTVVPNRTYHIKLVIADDGDTAFDSAVFLNAGSFDIGEVDLGEDILVANGNANCEGDEIILDVGVPVGSNATITWFTIDEFLIQEPVLDANGIPESGLTLTVTESNTYQVEIVLNASASCFVIDNIIVEFFPTPITPENLPDILGCDTDNTGFAIFDLTDNDVQILGTQTGLTISYYLAEQDATDGVNPIANSTAYQSTPTIIYYRIEDDITGCFKVSSFNLALAPKPVLVQANTILACDDNADGIANYDLTLNESVISNGQSGFVFSYYTSLADAETSMNAIANPLDFEGIAQIIYVRVENANGCFETTTFNIDLAPKPILVQSGTILGCDDNEDGIAN
ncbi:choice-of-anchor L domain-containing protein, partial [Lacinutrix sp.]|uniref:choice-of-anchor L domain-containing protein n=1 Tax=Lacinutrix sp. TaxID=1937692 RepID=UPI0025C11D2A